jgi:Domain of unknown function (DUF5348)
MVALFVEESLGCSFLVEHLFLWLLLCVCERRGMKSEGVLGYGLGHYQLVDHHGMDQHCLQAGDVFEVRIGGEFQAVRLKSGGYKGWYFVTAADRRARPALCMKARVVDSWLAGHT